MFAWVSIVYFTYTKYTTAGMECKREGRRHKCSAESSTLSQTRTSFWYAHNFIFIYDYSISSRSKFARKWPDHLRFASTSVHRLTSIKSKYVFLYSQAASIDEADRRWWGTWPDRFDMEWTYICSLQIWHNFTQKWISANRRTLHRKQREEARNCHHKSTKPCASRRSIFFWRNGHEFN